MHLQPLLSIFMEIRRAFPEDSASIVGLLYQLGYQVELTSVENMIVDSKPGVHEIYVAVLDDVPVATCSIIYFWYFPAAQRYCRVTSIVVDENNRGKGIGRILLDKVVSRAIAESCSSLEVTTSINRISTHRFYESYGFDKTSFKYVLPISKNV